MDQWWTTLEAYVLPKIGTTMVGDVTPGDMLDVLSPIWLAKPETARRVKQRCSLVFNWATTKSHRSPLLQNPAEVCVSALPTQEDDVEHHPAVMWQEAPKFLAAVRDCRSTGWHAAGVGIPATHRGQNIRGALSRVERDRPSKGTAWTVPAARMKRKKDHRVALSEQAIAVLKMARAMLAE